MLAGFLFLRMNHLHAVKLTSISRLSGMAGKPSNGIPRFIQADHVSSICVISK